MAELIPALKSLQEAADLLGVSVFTIRRLIKAGEIRAVHVGARVLVPAAEIERVANHGVGVARVGKPRNSAKVRQRKCELAIAPGDLLQELNRKPYPLLLFGGGQTDGLGRRRLWHLGHLPSPTC